MKNNDLRHIKSGVLIRPALLEDECRQYYLQRIAADNGMNGIPELCRSLNTTYSALVSCPADWIGSTLAGIQPSKRILKRPKGRGYYLYGLSQKSRICPECIHERLPIPPSQNFSLAIRCSRHSIMLVDECPGCASPLSYLRREITHCDCGYALRKATARSSETWVNAFYSIFAPWRLGSTSSTEEKWPNLEFGSISILSELLKQTGSAMDCLWLRSQDWKACSRLASDWHTLGQEVLAAIWESGDRKARNRININLHKLDAPLLRASIQDAGMRVREAAKARYREKIIARLFSEGATNNAVATPSEVRKVAKLDAAATQALLNSGALGQVAEATDGRVVYRRVPVEGLSKLKTLWLSTLSADDAAAQIGCDKYLLLDLAHWGLVNAHLLNVKPRAPRFMLNEIDRFLVNLRTRSLPIPHRCKDYALLEIFPVRDRSGNRKKLWRKVLDRMKDGLLPLYSIPPSMKKSFWGVAILFEDLRLLGTSEVILNKLAQCTYERHVLCS